MTNSKITCATAFARKGLGISDSVFSWIGLLPLRLILAVEFWDSGVEKYAGENWFESIKGQFPYPFNIVSTDFSWFISTWFELIGAVLLVFGLFTRFISISLVVLTVVAVAAVHWPESWSSLSELWKGYAISNRGFGNYKLPLLYLIMFVPLLLAGPGRLSVDNWLRNRFMSKDGF